MRINQINLYHSHGETYFGRLSASDGDDAEVSFALNEEERNRLRLLAEEFYNARKEQISTIVAKPAGLAIEHKQQEEVYPHYSAIEDIPF